ncbi:restriction endonuclease [uncultured Sulfuricurvum sp.]|uniref:restriction endonuclease n=1 Tax=uncultured Sulfuricurvum sp. TaxID=430693 RepID=UPI002618FC63|nr:restriction endonuclease [uncultured Sulfuricurvum sp.]
MQKSIFYKQKLYLAVTIYIIALVAIYFLHGFVLSIYFALTVLLMAYFIHIIVDFAEFKFDEKDLSIQQKEEEKNQLARVHKNEIRAVMSFLEKERQKIDEIKNNAINEVQISTNHEIEKIRLEAEERIKKLQEAEQYKLQEIEQKYKNQIVELEKAQSSKNGWIPKEEWLKLQKEKEEKGRLYELKVGEHFENEGYAVEYRGISLGKRDGGIDLIARKEAEVILIQCKNWKGNIKIKQADIRKFYGDCSKYIEDNLLSRDEVQYRYIIPSKSLLDYQAERFFIENHTRIRYVVIEA